MLTVHHLNNSRSQRVLWLLEELGVPYEIKHYQRDPQTLLAPASLRAVHPLGKSPVVTDGPRTLAESGAIIEYLVDRYGQGRLKPTTEDDELRYHYWLHYAEGSLMPPLLLKLVFLRLPKGPIPALIKPIARMICGAAIKGFVDPQLKTHLDYLESELGRSTWFAGGEFSGADIQMSFPIEAAVARAGLDSSRPRLLAYLRRIQERPAYQRALERGGPYSLLG